MASDPVTIPMISMTLPRTLAFGAGCARRCVEDLAALGKKYVFVATGRSTRWFAEILGEDLASAETSIWDQFSGEPTIEDFERALAAAREVRADAVIGIGGGSPMDVAKLVAAFLGNDQRIRDTFGIGKLAPRATYLACIPTTAGTGSEVSPNAILLDESEHLKKGVISPHLMPDAAYVDPALTLTVPPSVTAATGMDALTHCIEAYANLRAHLMIDLYALQGIKLISQNLLRCVQGATPSPGTPGEGRGEGLQSEISNLKSQIENTPHPNPSTSRSPRTMEYRERGQDGASEEYVQARTRVALGSMYGGMCLGPVNTGAVHALAYPLGGEFHVAHGVSNAVLLPHVLEFNLPAAPKRYAEIAVAMGCRRCDDDLETARGALTRVCELSAECGIPAHLSDLGIPDSAIEHMAESAMTVTRLLERNVRPVTMSDAIKIYRRAF